MSTHHVKVEPVWILVLEVAQKGFAESCRLDNPTNRVSLEEGVKLCHSSVQSLGGGAALEFKVHLLRTGGTIAGGADESGEFLCMEGRVLDGRICEPTVDTERKTDNVLANFSEFEHRYWKVLF